MTNANQKQIIAYLIHYAAVRMLSNSPVKSKAVEDAKRLYGKLRASESAENLKGVDFIGTILESLIRQMVRCNDVSQLENVMQVVEGIEKGDVYLAAEGQELIFETPTQL